MIISDTLPCGVRIVYEKLPDAQAASIGIWVGAGSYSEEKETEGISHFIEHMLFKGTSARTAKQIAEDTDKIGSQINAFTSKEATCYHIKALTNKFADSVDILLDMFCESIFDPAEIKKERGVILEEMNMVEDTPDDYIFDLLTGSVLKGTDLESSIIGTRRSLKNITRDKILDYTNRYYTKDNIVIAVVGQFDEEKLYSQLEEAFRNFPGNKPERLPLELTSGKRFKSKVKDIGQTHIAIGIPSVSLSDPKYYAQAIVNDVLGGSMSSRLFQNIREEKGLAYSVYSAASSYTQTGMFFIYAGTSPGKEQEVLRAFEFELNKLGKECISAEDLKIVKQRLKSSYIFSLESMNSRMYRLGKNQLLLGRHYTEEETLNEIDSVTIEDINEICRKISDFSAYSGVAISKNRIDLKKMMQS